MLYPNQDAISLLLLAMFHCPHVQWLELDRLDRRWTLTDPGRLKCVVSEFLNPRQQTPSVVFFVGNNLKSEALRNIYPNNNISGQEAHGIANLRVEAGAHEFKSPTLFADCTPGAPCMSLLGPRTICHENHRHTICADDSPIEDVITTIQVNFILPFSHVVCVFADDLGGNYACARYIEGWMRKSFRSTSSRSHANPHLLIATTDSSNLDALVQIECDESFSLIFESFQILSEAGSSRLKFPRLKTTLQHVTDDASRSRGQMHLLFNAADLANLFSFAVSQDPTKPIDLLISPLHRASSISAQYVVPHLQTFLSLSAGHLSERQAVELVASALLTQYYPPTAHCRCLCLLSHPVAELMTDHYRFPSTDGL